MSAILNHIMDYLDRNISYKKSDGMDDSCNRENKEDDSSPNNDSVITASGLDSSQEEELTTTPENKYFVVSGSTPLTLIFKRYSISDTTANNCVVRTIETVQNEIYFSKTDVPSSSETVNLCYAEPLQAIESENVEVFNQHPIDTFSSQAFTLTKSCVADNTSNIDLLAQTSIINCESTFHTTPVLDNEVSITNLNNTCINLVSGSEQDNISQSVQNVEQQLCRNNLPLSVNTAFHEGNVQILENSFNTVCDDYSSENGSNFRSLNSTSAFPPTVIHGNGCSDNVYFITSEGQNNFEVRNNAEPNLVQLLYPSTPAVRNVYQAPYQIILTNEAQVGGIADTNISENDFDTHNSRSHSKQVEFINNTIIPEGNEVYFSGKLNESVGLIPSTNSNFINEAITSNHVISGLKYNTNVLLHDVNTYSNENNVTNLPSLNQCSAQYEIKNENLDQLFSVNDKDTVLEPHKILPVEMNSTHCVASSESLLHIVTAPVECQQTVGSPTSVYYISGVQDDGNSRAKQLVKNNWYSSCTNMDSGYSEGCSAGELWNASTEIDQNHLSIQVSGTSETLNTNVDKLNEQTLNLTSQPSTNLHNIDECETIATKCSSSGTSESVSNKIHEETTEQFNEGDTTSKPYLPAAPIPSDFNCQFTRELSPTTKLTLQSSIGASADWDSNLSQSMMKLSTGINCSVPEPTAEASFDMNCTLDSSSNEAASGSDESLPISLSETSTAQTQSIEASSISNCLLPVAPDETLQISNHISNSDLNTNNELMYISTNSLFESNASTNTSYMEHSPLLFTSEDEAEDSMKQKTCATPRGKENTPRKRNKLSSCPKILASTRKRFEHIQELLSGIPPPPKITMPPYSVSDMLQLLKENENLLWDKNLKETEESGLKIKSKQTLQNVLNVDWPEMKNVDYFSIHYNHGTLSEDLDLQYQKWQERYVAREAASSCNIWFTSSVSGNSNNKKRRSIGQSPGRRLSHLARRRQSFSCNSLHNSVAGKLPGNLHNTALERRLIMVEIKKTEKQQKVMGQSNTSTENNSIGKSNLLNSSRLSSSRRALFQSPNDNEKSGETGRPRSTSKRMDRVRRNLLRHTIGGCDDAENHKSLTNNEVNANGKRLREEELMLPRKFSRRLNFNNSPLKGPGYSPARRYSTSTLSCAPSLKNTEMPGLISVSQPVQNLQSRIDSTLRKKLLWAVAEALKKEGITLQHHLFRACASSLTAVLRQSLSGSATEMKTSDQMLKVARLHVTEIVTNVKAKLAQV